MPRIARAVAVGMPHHVTQRGNNRQSVFFVDEDRMVYLRLLKQQAERFDLTIHGYCLMTNHVHLIVVPHQEHSLAKGIGRAHYDFTRYINHLHGRRGHLWQNRFFSCPVDEAHYWTALSYIERNPVRAKIVRKAGRYRWSSAFAHVTGIDRADILDMSRWRRQKHRDDWAIHLAQRQDEHAVADIRASLGNGRPLGSDGFVSKVETLVGRRLRAAPVGRPPGSKEGKRKRTKR